MQAVVKSGLGNFKVTEQQLASDANELFDAPAIDVTYEGFRTIIYTPSNVLSDEGPLQFNVLGIGNEFINPREIYCYFQLQILKDADKIPASEFVAPVNGIGNAMFKSIGVDIKDRTLPELITIHPNYKNHIEKSCHYGQDAINTHMESEFWYWGEDFGGVDGDGTTFDGTTDNAFKKRLERCKKSKVFEVISKPSCDFCSIEKLIPPGINLRFNFTRAADELVLNCSKAQETALGNTVKYKIHIVKAELHVKYLTLNSKIVDNIINTWRGRKMKLPITRTSWVTQTRPSGIRNLPWTQVYTGVLPKQLITCFLPTDQWNGKYSKHCFKFNHTNVEHFCVRKNGTQIPATAYTIDFKNDLYMRLYKDFCNNVNMIADWGTEITFKNYKENYCFFIINFNEDCNGFHTHQKETGTLEIDIRLSQDLAESTIQLAVGYSDGFLLIDEWLNADTTFAIAN